MLNVTCQKFPGRVEVPGFLAPDGGREFAHKVFVRGNDLRRGKFQIHP
jgi:hypothetical protein